MAVELVILEDSSQAIFGGGQRITLEMINCIQTECSFVLIDTCDSPWHKKIIGEDASVISLHLGKYFTNPILFNFFFFFLSTWKVICLKPTYLYITTRKNLIPALFIKCIRPNTTIIYHYHLLTGDSWFWSLYDTLVAGISTHLIFTSQYTLSIYKEKRWRLIKYIENRCLIAPIPPSKWADSHFTNLKIPINPIVIGFVGKITEKKGVLLFIEALKKLPLELNWQGIIAGSGPLSDVIKEECSKKYWNGRIQYLGPIETNADFYATLSILTIPTFTDTESLGLSALEGIQAGIPTLVADKGNLHFFILDGLAYPLTKPNPTYIAKEIYKLYEMLKKSQKREPHKSIKNDRENYKKFFLQIFKKG